MVSIDDLGTGYASIALLKTLPVHELKIDLSFIHDMPTEPRDRFVAALIALAHAIDVRLVAEAVERQEQCDVLTVTGRHVFQGYLISHPMAAEAPAVPLDGVARQATAHADTDDKVNT
jgi:EAL domain-containing protein (putative c-di-GMP-specific phosphodiesterase class I)